MRVADILWKVSEMNSVVEDLSEACVSNGNWQFTVSSPTDNCLNQSPWARICIHNQISIIDILIILVYSNFQALELKFSASHLSNYERILQVTGLVKVTTSNKFFVFIPTRL